MEDFMSEKFSELYQEMEEHKMNVILSRLKEKGIDFDMHQEQHYRFKKIMCEHTGILETYYYNDGSEQGFRIVTFEKVEQDLWKPNELKIGIELKYY